MIRPSQGQATVSRHCRTVPGGVWHQCPALKPSQGREIRSNSLGCEGCGQGRGGRHGRHPPIFGPLSPYPLAASSSTPWKM